MKTRVKVEIYVGIGVDKNTIPILPHFRRGLVKDAARYLENRWGGVTVLKGTGYFKDFPPEKSVVFVIVTDNSLYDTDNFVKTDAAFLKELFTQAAVYVTIQELRGGLL